MRGERRRARSHGWRRDGRVNDPRSPGLAVTQLRVALEELAAALGLPPGLSQGEVVRAAVVHARQYQVRRCVCGGRRALTRCAQAGRRGGGGAPVTAAASMPHGDGGSARHRAGEDARGTGGGGSSVGGGGKHLSHLSGAPAAAAAAAAAGGVGAGPSSAPPMLTRDGSYGGAAGMDGAGDEDARVGGVHSLGVVPPSWWGPSTGSPYGAPALMGMAAVYGGGGGGGGDGSGGGLALYGPQSLMGMYGGGGDGGGRSKGGAPYSREMGAALYGGAFGGDARGGGAFGGDARGGGGRGGGGDGGMHIPMGGGGGRGTFHAPRIATPSGTYAAGGSSPWGATPSGTYAAGGSAGGSSPWGATPPPEAPGGGHRGSLPRVAQMPAVNDPAWAAAAAAAVQARWQPL